MSEEVVDVIPESMDYSAIEQFEDTQILEEDDEAYDTNYTDDVDMVGEPKSSSLYWKIGLAFTIIIAVIGIAFGCQASTEINKGEVVKEEKDEGSFLSFDDNSSISPSSNAKSGGCGTGCILAIVGASVVTVAAIATIAFCCCCNSVLTTTGIEVPALPKPDCTDAKKTECNCKKGPNVQLCNGSKQCNLQTGECKDPLVTL